MDIIDSIAMLLVAIFLLYSGVDPFVHIQFPAQLYVLSIYSIVTGLLFLVARIRNTKPFYAVGIFLLMAWFVMRGVIPLLAADMPGSELVLNLLGGLAGIPFLTMIREERNFTNIGQTLFGLHLIGAYLLPVLGLTIPYGWAIFSGVAIVAGILLILGF